MKRSDYKNTVPLPTSKDLEKIMCSIQPIIGGDAHDMTSLEGFIWRKL